MFNSLISGHNKVFHTETIPVKFDPAAGFGGWEVCVSEGESGSVDVTERKEEEAERREKALNDNI